MTTEGKFATRPFVPSRDSGLMLPYIKITSGGYSATFESPERECWIARWRVTIDGGMDVRAVDAEGNPVELRRIA